MFYILNGMVLDRIWELVSGIGIDQATFCILSKQGQRLHLLDSAFKYFSQHSVLHPGGAMALRTAFSSFFRDFFSFLSFFFSFFFLSPTINLIERVKVFILIQSK